MKDRAIISLVMFLTFILFYSIAQSAERPKDFRGITWGTHISKVPGLSLKEEFKKTGEKIYVRSSDSLKVKYGHVDAIEYNFMKERLTAIIMRLGNYNQYENLKSLLLDLYGTPDKEEKGKASTGFQQHFTYWFAEKGSEANISLVLTDIFGNKSGKVVMEWRAAIKQDTGL